MKDQYIRCYLDGRRDQEEYEFDIDIDALAEKVGNGAQLRDVALEAAKKEIAKDMDASAKTEWLKDNLETIRTYGGDTEKAWRLYMQGMIDELACELEPEICATLDGQEDDDEDDDETENPDDDEEDDDDD